MICESCGNARATTHITRIVDGRRAEYHLCAGCAKKNGLHTVDGFDLTGMWNALFAEPSARAEADAIACPVCGSTVTDIVRSGFVGCPHCYVNFYDRLLPSIQRIHGKAVHAGKLPGTVGERAKITAELERLRAELSEKLIAEAYEDCASLRDRIRELEFKLVPVALPAPTVGEEG